MNKFIAKTKEIAQIYKMRGALASSPRPGLIQLADFGVPILECAGTDMGLDLKLQSSRYHNSKALDEIYNFRASPKDGEAS